MLNNNDKLRCVELFTLFDVILRLFRDDISNLHNKIPSLMYEWRISEALVTAQTKLQRILQLSDQMTTIVPSAMMEVYEIWKIAQVKMKIEF